jgi:hypothetical protein
MDQLLALDGETIGDLIAVTGWLAHTTRAALTGLRRRGYAVAIDGSEKERGSIYFINTGPTLKDKATVAHSESAQATITADAKQAMSHG